MIFDVEEHPDLLDDAELRDWIERCRRGIAGYGADHPDYRAACERLLAALLAEQARRTARMEGQI